MSLAVCVSRCDHGYELDEFQNKMSHNIKEATANK